MSRSNSATKRSLLGGYYLTIKDEDAKKRYVQKLSIVGGVDPYEVNKDEWKDDVELWPNISYVNVGMFLLLTPSPYSGEELKNYKSLDCYKNFLSGWVREVLVMPISADVTHGSEKMTVLIAKVRHCRQ